MSIPKKIHYCWFGGAELPASAQKCIQSWKKFCPDFEIIRWDESNFDISQNRYASEAYAAKKWAFVSDYARLKIIEEHGGIYFDTDVELLRPIDDLLQYSGFMGYGDDLCVSTGLGFGAIPNHPVVGAILADYAEIPFLLADGSYDMLPCPKRNTEVLKALGLTPGKAYQTLLGMIFLPQECLCPMNYYTGKINKTENTYSIHRFDASWTTPTAKRTTRLKRLIGIRAYDFLYAKFLHKFNGWEW